MNSNSFLLQLLELQQQKLFLLFQVTDIGFKLATFNLSKVIFSPDLSDNSKHFLILIVLVIRSHVIFCLLSNEIPNIVLSKHQWWFT